MKRVMMPTDDELAELVAGHMSLDQLGVPTHAVDVELPIGRRIALLVQEMEAKQTVSLMDISD